MINDSHAKTFPFISSHSNNPAADAYACAVTLASPKNPFSEPWDLVLMYLRASLLGGSRSQHEPESKTQLGRLTMRTLSSQPSDIADSACRG